MPFFAVIRTVPLQPADLLMPLGSLSLPCTRNANGFFLSRLGFANAVIDGLRFSRSSTDPASPSASGRVGVACDTVTVMRFSAESAAPSLAT